MTRILKCVSSNAKTPKKQPRYPNAQGLEAVNFKPGLRADTESQVFVTEEDGLSRNTSVTAAAPTSMVVMFWSMVASTRPIYKSYMRRKTWLERMLPCEHS